MYITYVFLIEEWCYIPRNVPTEIFGNKLNISNAFKYINKEYSPSTIYSCLSVFVVFRHLSIPTYALMYIPCFTIHMFNRVAQTI